MNRSEFKGNTVEYIAYVIATSFVSFISLGLLFPYMKVEFNKWLARNTIIDGKRIYFDGRVMELFLLYIKWALLTIITFGIYGLFVPVAYTKWLVKNTHIIENES